MSKRKDTEVIKAGDGPARKHHVVNTPVYHASTVTFDSYAELRHGVRHMDEQFFYGRMGSPTQFALEQALADLEGGAAAKLFPSGMAAVAAAIFSLVRAGDHILVADNVYEPVRKLAGTMLKRLGVTCEFFDSQIGAGIGAHFTDQTRLVFVEAPGSLTFEMPDIKAMAGVAKARGAYLLVDNTWATPLYFNPLSQGADYVIHAATKYIVGHSDVMMGIVVARQGLEKRLRRMARQLGQVSSPDDAYLAHRGLKTLAVRLERHQQNALEVAAAMVGHPLVDRVLHPAFEGTPGHHIWQRDFSGASGLFSIVLKRGRMEDMGALVDQMVHFRLGFSWGGFESLILPADPATMRTATAWQGPGPLLRLSVGLEDPADLVADLEAALGRFDKTAR